MPGFENIQTDPELLRKLASATSRTMSAQEMREQKISFIFGQLSGRVPKEKIEEVLDKQEGRA